MCIDDDRRIPSVRTHARGVAGAHELQIAGGDILVGHGRRAIHHRNGDVLSLVPGPIHQYMVGPTGPVRVRGAHVVEVGVGRVFIRYSRGAIHLEQGGVAPDVLAVHVMYDHVGSPGIAVGIVGAAEGNPLIVGTVVGHAGYTAHHGQRGTHPVVHAGGDGEARVPHIPVRIGRTDVARGSTPPHGNGRISIHDLQFGANDEAHQQFGIHGCAPGKALRIEGAAVGEAVGGAVVVSDRWKTVHHGEAGCFAHIGAFFHDHGCIPCGSIRIQRPHEHQVVSGETLVRDGWSAIDHGEGEVVAIESGYVHHHGHTPRGTCGIRSAHEADHLVGFVQGGDRRIPVHDGHAVPAADGTTRSAMVSDLKGTGPGLRGDGCREQQGKERGGGLHAGCP